VISDDVVLPYFERVREQVPGLEYFDVHTHIGRNDPDGYRCEPDQLTASLDRADARGVVFPMHEPDGYPAANDEVIAAAEASAGRLVPFCRLDPASDPVAEAERALAAGARGIKLHPRAERFTLDHPALDGVFALADARRLPVLVHAGRGIPALGRHATERCARFPAMRLILAHAGICDLAWIWRAAAELPNLYFDTAWWAASDLLSLFALVPPGQVLFGSDAPYGTPTLSAAMVTRYALQVGLTPDQLRGVAGGQVERLVAAAEPLELGPAPGTGSLSADPLLDRVYTYLAASIGQMVNGLPATEMLGLARLACEVGDDAPQAELCGSILALLEAQAAYRPATDDGRPRRFHPGVHLIVLAAALSRTPAVPLPPVPAAGDVADRTG
jgi:predicted TIM-barrel fold metal-dependent hydrolase